jgi:hypothetical protein
MNIKDHNFGVKSVVETVKLIEQQILVSFVDGEETDVLEFTMFYEDRDGENWLSYFTIENNHDDKIVHRSCMPECLLNHLNSCIEEEDSMSSSTKCFSKKFEVTPDLLNYVDNIIEEAMQKSNIQEG